MSITQDRMLTVIRAGQDYQQALVSTASQITSVISYVDKGKMTPTEALEQLRFIGTYPAFNLRDPASPSILHIEAEHFRRVGRDNRRRAEKLAAKRGGLVGERAAVGAEAYHYQGASRTALAPEDRLELAKRYKVQEIATRDPNGTLSAQRMAEIESEGASIMAGIERTANYYRANPWAKGIEGYFSNAEIASLREGIPQPPDPMIENNRAGRRQGGKPSHLIPGLDGPEADAVIQASFDDPNAPSLPVDFDED